MINIRTSLNNLKTEVDDLDAVKLKTIPIDLKKACHVLSKEVVKNTNFNKLNREVNNFLKKFLMQLL